jgi:hypothetical protein
VYGAIRRIKNNRAPAQDAKTAELTKEGSRYLWKNAYQLIVSVWDEEIMPEEWQTVIICPIFRKGNKSECENYRGISLLNIMYKIFTDTLAQRTQHTQGFLASIKVHLGKITALLITYLQLDKY